LDLRGQSSREKKKNLITTWEEVGSNFTVGHTPERW